MIFDTFICQFGDTELETQREGGWQPAKIQFGKKNGNATDLLLSASTAAGALLTGAICSKAPFRLQVFITFGTF
jgi:hypothetical protein